MYSRNTKTTNQTTANNNKSYAEGFLVVLYMRQYKITLKMSPALYQEEEEEEENKMCVCYLRGF